MKIAEVIIVEGKYDRQALENIVDATIMETGGFRIFKQSEQALVFRQLAEKRGIVILTDSDRAGFAIRNHICGAVDKKYIKNAYIPNLNGKEKRKKSPSKEGILGVEGMSPKILRNALIRAGVTIIDNNQENNIIKKNRPITKADLYEDGLCGGDNSVEKRIDLFKKLNLPRNLSATKLLEVLNILYNYDEYKEYIKDTENNTDHS
jgi:ribonuclease M5